MNILVISNTPWSDNNSFGNSFSNIFKGIPDINFANVYCRAGEPNNQFPMVFFQITEKSLMKNLFHREYPSGSMVLPSNKKQIEEKEILGFEQARKMRWQVMFWGRNLIWKIGRWKSDELKMFLSDFKPDIIFQPIYSKSYINDIVLYAKDFVGCPMIGYISDDNYTLKQFRFSPLYWIDRLFSRRKVKLVVEKCEILYVISKIQKEEYEKIFTPVCKILTKCADFSKQAPNWNLPGKTVDFIFAGNIGAGRWRSLGLISRAIEKLRGDGYGVELNIYTSTPMTKKIRSALEYNGTFIHDPIPYQQIIERQKKADVVIHVEGLSKKSQMEVHQSFSTKLVDYFMLGKCIVAVGTEYEASIQHLKENDAAVVIEAAKDVLPQLKELLDDPEKILLYGQKAYNCGKKHHDQASIKNMVMTDIRKIVGKYS